MLGRRPTPRAAWLFILGGVVTLFVAGLIIGATNRLTQIQLPKVVNHAHGAADGSADSAAEIAAIATKKTVQTRVN